MVDKAKILLQEQEYFRPYHHLVSFKTRKIYDFLSWGLEYYAYVTAAIDLLPMDGIKRVAEVGCGDGKIILELAKKYPDIEFAGYDISERAIFFAKAYGHNYPNLSFYNADFRNSSIQYDAVFCVETLEHISDEELPDFVSNLRLRVKKWLIVSVPTTNVALNPKHYRHYDLNLLRIHLDGFRIIHAEYIVKNNWFSRVLPVCLANRFFITRTQHLVNPVFDLYEKFCKRADEKTGWHLVVKCELAV